MPGITDSGPLQDGGRADRAGREHGLDARRCPQRLRAARELDPRDARSGKRKPVDECAGHDVEVGAFARRPQKRLGRAPTDSASLGDLEFSGAVVVARVEVIRAWDAGFFGRFSETIENVPV